MRNDTYRKHYQQNLVAVNYSGKRHLTCVAVTGLTLIVAVLARYAPGAAEEDWLVVPMTLLMASFVEYWVHRGPMHHPMPGLLAIYERHGRRHHRYFTPQAMTFNSHRDLHAVLFPPVLIVLFATIAVGLGTLVALAWSVAAGGLFIATVLAYYLAYEALHIFYHLPELAPGRRWRWLAFLTRHHRLHHDPRRMLACNFNLVLPIFDWVFRTLLAPPGGDSEQGSKGNVRESLAQSDKIEPGRMP